MIKIEGKGGISATIVADSISEAGQRITTYELNYPRFIHSEFMTHRQFSRNAASSRAIPIKKMIEQVKSKPVMPIHWGKNQSGMQAKEEISKVRSAKVNWMFGLDDAVHNAKALTGLGLHKQIVNRILEPYQFIKVVCTATEYENFFYLRNHADAQPEIAELARCMQAARDISEPIKLRYGDWHLPYMNIVQKMGGRYYTCGKGSEVINEEDAIKISASLCCQVSYRKSDESLDKAIKLYDMLVGSKPCHSSPFEHLATPMEPGVIHDLHTHTDKWGSRWSGNFREWGQFRQGLEGHTYYGDQRDFK